MNSVEKFSIKEILIKDLFSLLSSVSRKIKNVVTAASRVV